MYRTPSYKHTSLAHSGFAENYHNDLYYCNKYFNILDKLFNSAILIIHIIAAKEYNYDACQYNSQAYV